MKMMRCHLSFEALTPRFSILGLVEAALFFLVSVFHKQFNEKAGIFCSASYAAPISVDHFHFLFIEHEQLQLVGCSSLKRRTGFSREI
jgi:hypothetical protein